MKCYRMLKHTPHAGKKLREEFKEWDDTRGIDRAIEKQASRCALG